MLSYHLLMRLPYEVCMHKLVCQWCGADGEAIHNDYACVFTIKCSKCHHEWQEVIDKEQDLKDQLDIVGD